MECCRCDLSYDIFAIFVSHIFIFSPVIFHFLFIVYFVYKFIINIYIYIYKTIKQNKHIHINVTVQFIGSAIWYKILSMATSFVK